MGITASIIAQLHRMMTIHGSQGTIKQILSYIGVQNQVKYGSQMDFFGIKGSHWIDLSAGTEFLSLPNF